MHVIFSPVLRGMKSIDQLKLFLTPCEALIDSSVVVVVITNHLNVLLPFSFSARLILLFFFICKDFHALLVFLIGLIHIFDYQTICTSRKLKWSAPVCVWVCVSMDIWMPCVQLHKYVFCFLGATNKALKKIQSTYLNNCSLTRTCTQTHTHSYKSIHNTFWQSYTEQHAHQSSPCLSSPAPLQGADVWGQLTASANFCVQSKQQHSALLAAKGNLLLIGGREGFWVNVKYHEDWRKKRSEKGCMQRWKCVKVVTLVSMGKFLISWNGAVVRIGARQHHV